MPLRWCDITDCSKPADRDVGSCMICSAHRCVKHLATAFHTCPSEVTDPNAFFVAYDKAKQRHLLDLLANVKFDALIETASRLHNNVPCTLPVLRASSQVENCPFNLEMVLSQMGGQNCHLDVHFTDGVVWIARLRLSDPTLPPHETQEKIFNTEVGVLNFLGKTKVPVPKVFHYAFESVVGTPFVLMEKLTGTPLQWLESSPQQKTTVMEQLVDIFLELEQHPFPKLGSLSNSSGDVGSFSQGHMFRTPSQSIGPFDDLKIALTSIIKHEIELIKNEELCTLAVDNYLTHLWRLERVPELVQQATSSSFYIKHFDDKGDHILVDKNHRITGIIDWEFASTECAQLAFGSPCMMWPVEEYYNGGNSLSDEEQEFAAMLQKHGRDDMADMVSRGRKYQRFLFFLGTAVSTERKEFEDMFQGLRKAFDGQKIDSYADWRSAAITQALARRDPILIQLLQSVGGRARNAPGESV